jgi:hypothetical protein
VWITVKFLLENEASKLLSRIKYRAVHTWKLRLLTREPKVKYRNWRASTQANGQWASLVLSFKQSIEE